MNIRKQAGFTIVEVMLFLAISGLLAVLLLGGWGTMINTQRYKDSTRTLQTFLQQQYNLVYNVENGRADNLVCGDDGVKEKIGGGDPRGQTDCVLLGRYVRISGEKVQVFAIVGKELSANSTAQNDSDAIGESAPSRVTEDLGLSDSALVVPWQATVVGTDNSPDAANYAIVIIRSPLSGTVHTYTLGLANDSSYPTVSEIVSNQHEKNDVQLCLDPGAPLSGGRMAVVVRAYATSQNFIDVLADGDNKC